jgi:hypothetical protein
VGHGLSDEVRVKLARIAIRNYKGFYEQPDIALNPHITIAVGRNASGKTSLLEVMSLRTASVPHRSSDSLPQLRSTLNTTSTVQFTLALTGDELMAWLRRGHASTLIGPLPSGQLDRQVEHLAQVTNHNKSVTISGTLANGDLAEVSSHFNGSPVPSGMTVQAFEIGVSPLTLSSPRGALVGNCVPAEMAREFIRRDIYLCAALRQVGDCPLVGATELARDASNLADCLLSLQKSSSRFGRFVAAVRGILPEVRDVRVSPRGNERLGIDVWFHDPASEREDLALPVQQTGTGVGQTLAITYIVLERAQPSLLLLDEPQSFLHPRASRALVDLLLANPQHQYVIATHSPEVIAAARNPTVLLVRGKELRTSVTPVDVATRESHAAALEEVGAKLSDVFGADAVLWVEGPSEERSLARHLEAFARRKVSGVRVCHLETTGDITGREAQRWLNIYKRLTDGDSLLPPAVGILLDREQRPAPLREDVMRHAVRAGIRLRFTQRRSFENYLLDPRVVGEWLRQRTGAGVTDAEAARVLKERIAAWAESADARNRCSEDGVAECDAAEVLGEVLRSVSEVEYYEKVADSVSLFEHALRLESDQLEPLRVEVCAMLEAFAQSPE